LLQYAPRQRQRCDEGSARLQRAAGVTLAQRHQRLRSLEERMRALDPRQVLARGYAWLSDDLGVPITTASALSAGQQVRAELVDGQATATLSSVTLNPRSER
jgi:exodeoxyribonuclease VII large subunit